MGNKTGIQAGMTNANLPATYINPLENITRQESDPSSTTNNNVEPIKQTTTTSTQNDTTSPSTDWARSLSNSIGTDPTRYPLTKYISSKLKPSHMVYVIGYNIHQQFTLKDSQHFVIDDHVINIHSGKHFNVYETKSNQFYVSGYNQNGECAIDETKSVTTKNKYDVQGPFFAPFTEMIFFRDLKDHKFKIKKVCTNSTSSNIFWVTTDGRLYGNGLNEFYQLGLGDKTNRSEPHFIHHLENVIDVKSAPHHCIAVCSNKHRAITIIKIWSNTCDMDIPSDIINLMGIFCGLYEIYSTGIGCNGHNGATVKIWRKITVFKDEIVKVECGANHILFLDTLGRVWAVGENNCGQLAINPNERKKPDSFTEPIGWFVDNGIVIKDIKCGYDMNLALGINGKCYFWGKMVRYLHGMNAETIYVPKIVDFGEDEKVILEIKCGSTHCYAMGEKNKHYLWGVNKYNECVTYDGREWVEKPYCINEMIGLKLSGSVVKSVYLGHCNTKLIVVNSKVAHSTRGIFNF